MARLLIIGSGGQGRVVADLIRALDDDEIAGVLDDYQDGGLPDVKFLGRINAIAELRSAFDQAVIAIGDNVIRRQVAERIEQLASDVMFATLVHPSAVLAQDVQVGAGSVVMAGAVVQTGTRIGKHCVINTSASIDHDNAMADYAAVGPGVCTGGEVSIGEQAFVGIGSMIAHQIRVGSNAQIGAGSTVLREMSDNVLAFGTPAKVYRTRLKTEPMLG